MGFTIYRSSKYIDQLLLNGRLYRTHACMHALHAVPRASDVGYRYVERIRVRSSIWIIMSVYRVNRPTYHDRNSRVSLQQFYRLYSCSYRYRQPYRDAFITGYATCSMPIRLKSMHASTVSVSSIRALHACSPTSHTYCMTSEFFERIYIYIYIHTHTHTKNIQ